MNIVEGRFQGKYRIDSPRMNGWDYSTPGFYFVTICTRNRFDYFGQMTEGLVNLNELGLMAWQCWLDIPKHFKHVELDEFIIMPNHVHGIIKLNDFNKTRIQNCVETQNFASLQRKSFYNNKFGPQSKNLSSIIRGYKIGVTKFAIINRIDFSWQSRFYDRVIRNDHELNTKRLYIKDNPIKAHSRGNYVD